jgi:hypothetical protein
MGEGMLPGAGDEGVEVDTDEALDIRGDLWL